MATTLQDLRRTLNLQADTSTQINAPKQANVPEQGPVPEQGLVPEQATMSGQANASKKTDASKATPTTLEGLQKLLAQQAYTPKTDEQIAQQAQGRYKAQYDAQRLSAQQQQQTKDQGLAQQLAALGAAYDRETEEAQKATQRSVSQLDRTMLGRGMQRSSYNAASQAGLMAQGEKTLADIQRQRTQQEGDIAGQRALAAEQLQAQLATLDQGYAADVQAAIDALRDQEYERGQAAKQYADQMALQLYQLAQGEKDSELQRKYQELQTQLLQMQIDQKKGGGGSRYYSGGGGDDSTGGGTDDSKGYNPLHQDTKGGADSALDAMTRLFGSSQGKTKGNILQPTTQPTTRASTSFPSNWSPKKTRVMTR